MMKLLVRRGQSNKRLYYIQSSEIQEYIYMY